MDSTRERSLNGNQNNMNDRHKNIVAHYKKLYAEQPDKLLVIYQYERIIKESDEECHSELIIEMIDRVDGTDLREVVEDARRESFSYGLVLAYFTSAIILILIAYALFVSYGCEASAASVQTSVTVTVESGVLCRYEGDVAICEGNVRKIYYNGWRIK